MAYGELGRRALKWATQTAFDIDPASMPPKIVITPLKVEECFAGLEALLTNNALNFEKAGDCYLVWKDDQRALFCEGGTGASNFADSSYILCHCSNVKEIMFIGTGAGKGEGVQSADVNLPTSCIRLESSGNTLAPRRPSKRRSRA